MRRLDKLQHDFLWNDTKEKQKFDLVRWLRVHKSMATDGLGIRSVNAVNKECWMNDCER